MIRLAFLLALFASSAFAQQQQPPTATQILGQQLGAVAAHNAELVEALTKERTENAKLKAEIEELKKPKPAQ